MNVFTRSLLSIGLLAGLFFTAVPVSHAQELVPDTQILMKGRVLSVEVPRTQQIPGTDAVAQYQAITALILDGPEIGKEVRIENDFLLLTEGETFYLKHTVSGLDGTDVYTVVEPYRLPWVLGVVGLFVVIVLLIGGKQGARALGALAGSFGLIFYVLLPGIIAGYSPLMVSVAVASVIIIFGSYVTHGFTKTTTSAVVGMIATILFTGFLAFIVVNGARLSGFSSEESVYLNINTRGTIDFAGLLLGGILIGLLGVLYDASIGQSVAVEEMGRIGPHLSRRYIFARVLRIGREHIGALVNTLAIAYVGASLPLLLLMYSGNTSDLPFVINRELFATEIVRAAIGSIGLVLTIPITTLIAVLMLHHPQKASRITELDEQRAIEEHAPHQ